MKCISDKKRERIKNFYFINDKKRSLYSDVLVRYIICKKFNITNTSIRFYTNGYGKPYFSNYNEFYFNIGHSHEWVLVGISKSELGVDIEYISDCRLDIAKRFFTTEEHEDLINTPVLYQSKLFYDLWCLKESYIKYKGLGLSINLNTFQTKVAGVSSMIFTEKNEKINVKNYSVDLNYCAGSCSIEQPANKILYVTLDEIWEYMNLIE